MEELKITKKRRCEPMPGSSIPICDFGGMGLTMQKSTFTVKQSFKTLSEAERKKIIQSAIDRYLKNKMKQHL